ncbi:MAG: hypothetical protein KAJ91_03885 [Candidatus Aenigmarchaeota archaeon]|nr:hypothetical protein [Candidatus Aenigmarchaeota archaeon]
MSLTEIVDIILTDEIIAGAVAGSIIIPSILLFFKWFWSVMANQSYKNKLMGDCKENDELCLIYLKEFLDAQKSNTYLHKEPDYDPPRTSNHYGKGINIPRVYAKCDVECMNDFVNVMGSAGKTRGIKIASVEKEWTCWDNPIVSIGGNFVTNKILEKCEPIYCDVAPDSFKLRNMKKSVKCNGKDYGLIMKTKNVEQNLDVFVLMGLGVRGTSAAGYFFRKYHNQIAKLYGSSPFALLLECELNQGREDARLFDFYPEPSWYKKLVYFFIWKKFNKYKNQQMSYESKKSNMSPVWKYIRKN